MIPLEIERKYLIRQNPVIFDRSELRKYIIQTYLISDEDIQRRVRKMTVSGTENYTKYFYTEKRFLSAVTREENEHEISAEEYERLLSEADPKLETIEKNRYIIIRDGQCFEIDVYPFSNTLATMEIELESEDAPVSLPPFVEVIREVTGEHDYSNRVLSLTKKFPDEQ